LTYYSLYFISWNRKLGAWIAQRRAPSVAKKYDEIGGGSPILEWTKKQGSLLTDLLNERNVSSAPHKYYIAFRYTHPLLDATLQDISRDGVERVVVFPQYPQYSCSTTGSSLNQLAAFLSTNKLSAAANDNLKKVSWSVIDRWSLNSGLIDSIVDLIQKEMKNKLDSSMDPSKVMLLFSAHSLPLYVVERGDTYTTEVASTVMAVMSRLQYKYPFRLVWQSKVGPLKWMSPYTDKTIKAYAGKGIKNFVVVPIAFVNEHIETLHELDIEYGEDLRKELKLENIIRVPTPNVHPAFIEGLHQEVSRHLSSQDVCSAQLKVTCPHCTNPSCSQMRKWLEGLSKRHQ
jgi:ferrochelatase